MPHNNWNSLSAKSSDQLCDCHCCISVPALLFLLSPYCVCAWQINHLFIHSIFQSLYHSAADSCILLKFDTKPDHVTHRGYNVDDLTTSWRGLTCRGPDCCTLQGLRMLECYSFMLSTVARRHDITMAADTLHCSSHRSINTHQSLQYRHLKRNQDCRIQRWLRACWFCRLVAWCIMDLVIKAQLTTGAIVGRPSSYNASQ